MKKHRPVECQVLWLQHHPAKPPVILEGLRVKVYKLAMPKSKVTPLEGALMEIDYEQVIYSFL